MDLAAEQPGTAGGPVQMSPRPHFHFTPPRNWLNDPNGLVHSNGEYHLFYQHNVASNRWGPMSWGHAVSPDLLRWQHLPVALSPDRLGHIFSGSAVNDVNNTAGFGPDALVAIFTHYTDDHQLQSLAYSTDRGRRWVLYSGNPVLVGPEGFRDFRDPKVFWWSDSIGRGHWVMVLAVGTRLHIYTSSDLKTWTYASEFSDDRHPTGTWETPELFSLPGGHGKTYWVAAVGVMDGGPAGGSGTRYFVGQFDGHRFASARSASEVLWADSGPDFYAAQSWNDEAAGRRIWLAWMNNWRYANDTPTTGWRGMMTVPRTVALRATDDGPRLVQQPVAVYRELRRTLMRPRGHVCAPGENVLEGCAGIALDIEVCIDTERTSATRLELGVRAGGDQVTVIGYDFDRGELLGDRSASGTGAFATAAPVRARAPVLPRDGQLSLRVLVDRYSVEAFADGGLASMTMQIFPDADSDGVALRAHGGDLVLTEVAVYALDPPDARA